MSPLLCGCVWVILECCQVPKTMTHNLFNSWFSSSNTFLLSGTKKKVLMQRNKKLWFFNFGDVTILKIETWLHTTNDSFFANNNYNSNLCLIKEGPISTCHIFLVLTLIEMVFLWSDIFSFSGKSLPSLYLFLFIFSSSIERKIQCYILQTEEHTGILCLCSDVF